MKEQWIDKRVQLLQEAEDITLTMAELDQKHDELTSEALEVEEADAEKIELELDSIEEEITERANALTQLKEAYRQGLPARGVSRCPFSGEILL